MEKTGSGTQRQTRRMIATAWMCQNSASGLAIGSFGPMVATYEAELHVARSLSTAGMPLMLGTLALMSPMVGKMVHRLPLRVIMTTGALLMATGFTVLAFAPSIAFVLLAYGLLIGPGYAMLGSIMPSTLISRWVPRGKVGQALGITNMPVLLGLVPLCVAAALPVVGRQGVFLGVAALLVLLTTQTLTVVDHPPSGDADEGASASARRPTLNYATILRRPDFWAITFCSSIFGSAGVSLATHIVPMSIGWGYAPASAALLMSINGLSGIAGSLILGRLADRIGGIGAVALISALTLLLWATLLVAPPLLLMIGISAALGALANGMVPTLAASINQRFGSANFSQVFGLFAVINLPLGVGAPLLAGIAFANTGSYAPAIIGECVALGIGCMVALTLHSRRSRAPLPA